MCQKRLCNPYYLALSLRNTINFSLKRGWSDRLFASLTDAMKRNVPNLFRNTQKRNSLNISLCRKMQKMVRMLTFGMRIQASIQESLKRNPIIVKKRCNQMVCLSGVRRLSNGRVIQSYANCQYSRVAKINRYRGQETNRTFE